MREKGWEERGLLAHPKNSDFGAPMIWVLFSGLPINRVFGEGVKSARGATAILAVGTTLQLETCLERPFTQTTVKLKNKSFN